MTTVLPITEIVSENEFFDYEAKYLGKSKNHTGEFLMTERKGCYSEALMSY
jgi:D-alanine-D-alanine ligase